MELLLGITILFLFFHLSSAFTPNNSYFLACGSTSTISLTSDNPPRNFISDSTFFTSDSNSLSLSNPNASSNSPTLYATARAFTEPSSYQFKLDSQGTHVLRLHFFPFAAQNRDLAAAGFNVSALDRFLLLANFNVPNTPTPIIKEYLLWVDTDELTITFTPNSNSGASSLAFVNAIEVFTAPTSLLGNSDLSIGSSGNTDQIQHQALETVYRINVGGAKVTPANDTLWRTWVPDDDYLFSEALSQEHSKSTNQISYSALDAAEVAPKFVYATARSMNQTSFMVNSINPDFNFNITWSFPVTPGYTYFIRMHFCDIVSTTYTALYFNVYIGDQFATENLHPADFTDNLAEAFFRDYALDVLTSQQVVNVSIGRSVSKTTSQTANAILNGLEIMKVNNSVGSLNGTFNPGSVPSQDSKKNRVSLAVLIPSIVGGVLLILVAIAAAVFCKRRRPKTGPKPKESLVSWSPFRAAVADSLGLSSKFTDGTAPNVSPNFNLGLHITLAEIKAATNDFDEKRVIGTGGFGKVYGGTLRDGTRVAVKRGMPGSRQGHPEFHTEIMVLSQIRHRHLVSLIGYCDERSEMILVYEYMEKGPLKKHLYGSDLPCLSWKQRLDICIGAARGLHYLHTGSSHIIIHRDVKSTNILLGDNYVAKVSDFGLSRSGPSYGETHVSTAVKGTFGYLDPEYFKVQKLTVKSDVYSFGVLLFEVLCARPVIDQRLSREEVNLAEWALLWQRKGQLEKIIDPRLEGKINMNSLRKFGETAEKCLAEYGVDRPTIGDVLWNLEYALQLQETELKREPFEDSVNTDSQIPVAAVARTPSTRISIDEECDGMTIASEDRSDITTVDHVFSQLITGAGR